MNKFITINKIVALFLFVVFLILYTQTAAPSVYDGDSGEITSAVHALGVAHTPGFPLYILSGRAFVTAFGFEDTARGLNIFSALATAFAVVFMYFLVRELKLGMIAGIVAATSFGLSDIVWSHAGVPRVYALAELFIVILLFLFLRWTNTKNSRYLYAFFFVWGLSLGVHNLLILVGLLPLYYWLSYHKELHFKLKHIFLAVLLFVLPLLQYLYIPWAVASTKLLVSWGDFSTFSGYINYFTSDVYRSVIGSRTIAEYIQSFWIMIKLLFFDVAPLVFMLALGGMVVAYKRHKLWFYFILSILFANFFIEAYYFPSFLNNFLFRYLYPSIIVLAISVAFFIEYFITTLIPYIREVIEKNKTTLRLLTDISATFWISVFVIVLIASSIPSLLLHYNHNNRRNNYIVPDISHNILITPEPDAILFSYSDTIVGSLQYYQLLGERSDMTIIPRTLLPIDWYVKNAMKTNPMIFNEELLRVQGKDRFMYIIRKFDNTRPVYTMFNPHSQLSPDYGLIPIGILYKIIPKDIPINLEEISRTPDEVWSQYTLRGLKGMEYKDSLIQELLPFYAQRYYNLAIQYVQLGEITKAKQALLEGLKIIPNHQMLKEGLEKWESLYGK